MSSSLYWHIEPKKEPLSNELKFVLRRLWGDPVQLEADERCLSELNAIKAADPSLEKEVDLLISAIGKYGSIFLKEGW